MTCQPHLCPLEDHGTDLPRIRYMEDKETIQDHQHSIIKGQSCLTNLVIFYDEVTKPVGKGRAICHVSVLLQGL